LGDPVGFEVNLYRALLRLAVTSPLPAHVADAATPVGAPLTLGDVSSGPSAAAARAARASTLPLLPLPPLPPVAMASTPAAAAALAAAVAALTAAAAAAGAVEGEPGCPAEPAFERAYRQAVRDAVDEELLPADRAAAFRAADAPSSAGLSAAAGAVVSPSSAAAAVAQRQPRRASDLIPTPPALALRAAFGHLF
jgi:hypothetical protein